MKKKSAPKKKAPKKKSKPLCPRTQDLDLLTGHQAIDLLKDICEQLDSMSMMDIFGTEGWRKYFGYED